MDATKKIAIVGTGYVGMACAIGFAEFGHHVTGFDIMPDRIEKLQQGITPYNEAGITESLVRLLDAGRIDFVQDLEAAVKGADFVVVAVGTPSTPSGAADLSAVQGVFSSLGQLDIGGSIVVLRSTVPPGTSIAMEGLLQGKAPVVFAPEFLREGNAVRDFLNPDRIVVGASSRAAAERYGRLFGHLDKPTLFMSLTNAEISKCMSNAFLAMKITFANEVANLCNEIDGDALDVLDAVGHDRRIGKLFLEPGIGFGGPCFEKDLKSLIHVSQTSTADPEQHLTLFRATLDANDRQPKRIVQMLSDELGGELAGTQIGVWGLAFKAGTDDVRDSLAMRVVEDLAARGATIVAYDPAVKAGAADLPCSYADTALQAADADALLVLTEWPEFREIDPWAIARHVRQKLVVDGRNLLDMDAVAEAGMTYRGVGRKRDPQTIELAATG